jgi:hypothetical protein
VNGRAIGCIALGAIVFVLIGIAGINVASSRIGCPNRLQWGARFYAPTGTPAPSPDTGGASSPFKLGSTFIGLITRSIYGPSSPGSGSPAPQPDVIAMDCGDGRFQTYRNAGAAPTTTPSPAAMLPLALFGTTPIRGPNA